MLGVHSSRFQETLVSTAVDVQLLVTIWASDKAYITTTIIIIIIIIIMIIIIECESKGNTSNNWSDWNYFKII
jgi:ABC-type transport system involved in cytochrome bd biosynthesis fused ATPase/permease subunit